MDKSQLPKMLKKLHFYLLLLSSLIGFGGFAQTYPISISTQVSQPSPIYLSSYADATTINSPIKIQLVLNDLTISNRQVKLKIYFQGNGISFSTNDYVVGARPLYLEGGFPLQLTNVDLAPYFEYQNLLGLNPNQYAQPLPEGVYNIYVEVFDFATGKKLSNKTGTTTIIFQNEPPFLNLPLNNASIMQQNIQNIIFSWTPRSINVSNVEYEFSLVEIWDKYTPVQNAFAYSPPLYTTTTRTTTLQYGISEPQLIPGKKYAWRIKAKAIFGAEEIGVFKNNGYTEIFSFDYEMFCTAPLGIKTSGVSENQAKIEWSGNIDNYDYQVNYREKNANSEWYKLVTPRESIALSNLKPNATYEYTVGASCEVGKYTHSTIKEFTTIARDEIAFAGCGIQPDPKDLANKTPLPELFPNDVVTAGDFPIVVLHSTGSNGKFSGDGYVTLPFLEKFRKLIDAADALGGDKINIGQFSRIRITFDNIGVNTDFKLISGEIVASYDAEWKGMADGDKILTDILGSDGKPVLGTIDFEVKSAVLNPNGSTTITGPNGQKMVVEKSSYDRVYTDNKGNTVNVPANGKGEPTITTGAEGGKALAANTNGMSASGEVTQISSPDVTITFEDGDDSKYAFDVQPEKGSQKLKDTYETIPVKNGGIYKVNYKAVTDLNGPDNIVANADFKNGKTKDDIVFKTNTGAAVDIKWTSDTKAEIKINRILNFSKESIIATVKGIKEKDPKDAAKTVDGKSEVAGKINIWQLTQKPAINITLLSVNGASTPNEGDAKEFLNEVYNKVGVQFDVTTQKVTIGTLPNEIQCGESGVFDVYTNDQNNIISQIESSTDFVYNDKTYYVLYTGKSGQNGYQGFMPLGGQYAFVFNNNLKTAAHELGHGIFGLKHPFTNKAEEGKTDLLMDYDENGTKLSHNDWDIIHSGGWKFYGFQKSSSGALAGGYGITPNFEFISAGKSNIVSTRANLVNKGILSGFLDEKGVRYMWNKEKKTYTVGGYENGIEYTLKPKKTLEKDDVLWLIYDYSTDCNIIKYVHTTYGELSKEKDFLNTDKVIAQKAVEAYIDKINKVSEKENSLFYSGYLGCNNFSEENVNNCAKISNDEITQNIDIISKAISDKTKNFSDLESILKKAVSICVLEKLPFEIRSKILDKYYDVSDDAEWEISYGFASTEDHFFIKDVFLTTPESQQQELIQSIKADNYKWITKLFDQGKTIKGFGNDVNYNQVSEIFLTLGQWAIKNYDVLKIKPTKKQIDFSSLNEYYPGQLPFLLGAGDYNVILNSGKETESRIISTALEVNSGRIGFYNKYNLIDLRTYVSATGSPSPKRDGTIEYKEDYDPFEPITIIAGTENKFGLEVGKEYIVPAVVALAFQGMLKEDFASENLRKASNSVMIISGTLAAPLSGGGSLVAVAASISTGGVAVGLIDNYMQDEIKAGRLDSNSLLSKVWDDVYISYSILDGGAGFTNLAFNSYRALSTVNFLNNFKKFESLLNASNSFKPGTVFNGFNEIKNAVTGSIVDTKALNSIKEFNKFDSFITPIKNFVSKKAIQGAMISLVLNVSIDGFEAFSTTNKVGNVVEFLISSSKAEVATAEIMSQFAGKIPKLTEDLNSGATVAIKTTTNGIAQEGKIAFAKIDDSNVIIATQINNKIVYNIIKMSGNTAHFYQSSPDSNNSDPSTKCTICPERIDNKVSSQLCLNLERLQKNTNNLPAISKLCGLSNLDDIVIKLLEFDIANQKAFLTDINESNGNSYICSNISKIDVEILKAWKLIQDARPNLNYKKDWAVLEQTKKVLSHSNVLTKLGQTEGLKIIIERNYTAPCLVCEKNNLKLIMLNDYLDYVDYFAANYTSTEKKGYEKVLGNQGIKSGGINQVIATAFVLRVLKENPSYISTITDFEEKIEAIDDDGNENKAFADIVENNNKIIECKSWEINGKAFQNFVKEGEVTGSVKQFTTYLMDATKVNSMDKIEYWFDKKKLNNSTDPKLIKEKFQEMMYNGTTLTIKGEAVFNAIWGNNALKLNLFENRLESAARLYFQNTILNDTSNSFYSFIKVK
ncbi:fibronectin type III domain-containing protein [Flavobacterium sp.]|uniref:fibronectin type III domain-containing protein n=1 Tax=Flavobacterium sp. TaxID=239 RepID=UPI00326596F0